MTEYSADAYGAGLYGDPLQRGEYGAGGYGSGGYGGARLPRAGSLLDRYIGDQAISITLGAGNVPLTAAGFVTIRHGRTSPDQQPDPSTCTLTVLAAALPSLPTLGDLLRIDLGADVAAWLDLTPAELADRAPRFVGHVTDLAVRPERQVTGQARVTITGVSDSSRLGRVYVGDVPWPAETDGQRADRILALAAGRAGLTVTSADAGTVTVLPRDVDRQPTLALLEQLSAHTGGVLAERRDGSVGWHDAEHRRDRPVSVTLDAADVLAPTATTQQLADVVNDVTVLYGDPQQAVTFTDALSADPVSGFGPMSVRLSTQLAETSDAETVARSLVARRARPRWSTPGLTVDLLRSVDIATAAACLALEFADLLAVTGFPTAGPFSAASLWVEGWTESIGRNEWRLALDVSDLQLTSPPLRWSDLDPDVRWSEVPPALRWLDTHTADALTA